MIHGHFRGHGVGEPAPFLRAAIHPIGHVEWTIVDYLIDTGADLTSVFPADAVRCIPGYLTHDYDADPSAHEVGGIGGSSTFVEVEIDLVVVDDEAGALISRRTVIVASPEAASLYGLPSLLGRDVLSEFALTVDPRRGEVTLDRSFPDAEPAGSGNARP